MDDLFTDLDLTTVCSGVLAEAFDAMFARRNRFSRRCANYPDAGLAAPRRPWRPQHGLARDVERAISRTRQGKQIVTLVHKHRAPLVRLAASPKSRRVVQAAVAPFVDGMWSADEVLNRHVTNEDVARFCRALSVAGENPDFEEVVAETRELLECVPSTSFDEVLGLGRV